jgi:hypothetical protein
MNGPLNVLLASLVHLLLAGPFPQESNQEVCFSSSLFSILSPEPD